MVRSENPAFIRLSDGRVLGRPKAGVRPAAPAGPEAEPRRPSSASSVDGDRATATATPDPSGPTPASGR